MEEAPSRFCFWGYEGSTKASARFLSYGVRFELGFAVLWLRGVYNSEEGGFFGLDEGPDLGM